MQAKGSIVGQLARPQVNGEKANDEERDEAKKEREKTKLKTLCLTKPCTQKTACYKTDNLL